MYYGYPVYGYGNNYGNEGFGSGWVWAIIIVVFIIFFFFCNNSSNRGNC